MNKEYTSAPYEAAHFALDLDSLIIETKPTIAKLLLQGSGVNITFNLHTDGAEMLFTCVLKEQTS